MGLREIDAIDNSYHKLSHVIMRTYVSLLESKGILWGGQLCV